MSNPNISEDIFFTSTDYTMKFLALTLLVVALSAHFATAQPPARKAPAAPAAAADAPDARCQFYQDFMSSLFV